MMTGKREKVRAQSAELSAGEREMIARVAQAAIKRVPTEQIRLSKHHARLHGEAKVTALCAAMRRFGFVEPIITDEEGVILSGVARWLACRSMKVAEVPVIALSHLSAPEKRALRIALGKFPELASWDAEQLRIELPAIVAELPDLAMEEIGFTVPEFDRLLVTSSQNHDPDDLIPPLERVAVSQCGDLWRLGEHSVLCGDALDTSAYERLLGNAGVRLVVTDPPYNVPVNGYITKRIGKFDEFAMAAGELSNDQFRVFLHTTFTQLGKVTLPGAIGFFFIDWRHARVMQEAADGAFDELKNIIVWAKDNPGLGSFYRSQHEFLLVYKISGGEHLNNFGLGQYGRTRSNVWRYAGMSSFAGRDEALELHATPKPVAMLVDAILDCSCPGDLVLDSFGGAGSTLIAAERTHRRARLIEISPVYVDTIIRRWEKLTSRQAKLDSGDSFSLVSEQRAGTADKRAENGEAKRGLVT